MSDAPPAPARDDSPWAPLAHPVFRMLWGVWVVANMTMWMNDVAAAWLMTTLTDSPVMVALVQTASTLPVFLLGLPSGALADIVDRRRYFAFTQLWVVAVAVTLCAILLADAMTAPLLLALTFANGIGLAMRWPVFAAIVPTLVPRTELPAALALNGIAMNASRIGGPIVAGAIIASAGSVWVFALNALLATAAAVMILRWKRPPVESALPGERFLGAIRLGVQYVRASPRMHSVLLRVVVFFVPAIALLALLPLVARQIAGGSATTFTVLLSSMGAGAIVAARFLPRLRQMMTRDDVVQRGTVLQAGAMVIVAVAPNVWVAAPAMVAAGMAWITVANSLTVSAQLGLPDWVRARGMSIYQMTMMGSSAIGAALWGQVASVSSVPVSLACAAAGVLLSVLLMRRRALDAVSEEDLTPSKLLGAPVSAAPIRADDGPVLVTIEYRVDPKRADEFRALMQDSRLSRLSRGAIYWDLFRDIQDPQRFVESFADRSWLEHLRRYERVTAADIALRERKRALHVGEQAPVVTRYIAERSSRS